MPPVGPGVSFDVSTDADGNVTSSVYANATLRVPRGSKQAYETTGNWALFDNIVEIDIEQTGIAGDLNGDGKVDIDDVNLAVNLVLENISPDSIAGNPDVDGSGTTDIEDINAIINIILTQ